MVDITNEDLYNVLTEIRDYLQEIHAVVTSTNDSGETPEASIY